MDDPIAEYYEADVQHEWDRLAHRRTEFAITMKAFEEYLPPSPTRVLDVGGGLDGMPSASRNTAML